MLDMFIVVGLGFIAAYTGYTWGCILTRRRSKVGHLERKDTETDTLNWLWAVLETIKIESRQVLNNGATPNGYEAKNTIRLAELAQGVITERLGGDSDGP